VERRRKKLINRRLINDKIMATAVLRTNQAKQNTQNTWGSALRKRHQDLHPDWISRDEVFQWVVFPGHPEDRAPHYPYRGVRKSIFSLPSKLFSGLTAHISALGRDVR
jgi:hypothetical protein